MKRSDRICDDIKTELEAGWPWVLVSVPALLVCWLILKVTGR